MVAPKGGVEEQPHRQRRQRIRRQQLRPLRPRRQRRAPRQLTPATIPLPIRRQHRQRPFYLRALKNASPRTKARHR